MSGGDDFNVIDTWMLLKRFEEEVVETPLEMLRYLEFIVSHKKSMKSKLANLTTTPMDREKRCLISNEIRKTETKLASHLSLFEEYLPEDLHMFDETDISSSEDECDNETSSDDELNDDDLLAERM